MKKLIHKIGFLGKGFGRKNILTDDTRSTVSKWVGYMKIGTSGSRRLNYGVCVIPQLPEQGQVN